MAVYQQALDIWTRDWNMTSDYRQTREWSDDPRSPIIPPALLGKMDRYELGALVRLVTGHNMLPRHKFIMDKAPHPICKFCDRAVQGSSWHVMCDCPKYSDQRSIYFGEFTLDELPQEKMKQVFLFIMSSGLHEHLYFNEDTHVQDEEDMQNQQEAGWVANFDLSNPDPPSDLDELF